LVSETGLAERSESIPVQRTFVVSIHLTPASSGGCEIWVDDKMAKANEDHESGFLAIVLLRSKFHVD
jgi:hypothetical protein